MRRNILIISFLLILTSGLSSFGVNKAGSDKIGAYVGWPVGLSYSHNFTKLDQIDLQLAFAYSWYGAGAGLDIYLGYLRTVYEPVVGGVVCPLEVGCGLGLNPYFGLGSFNIGMAVYFDLRWEVFIKQLPKLNLFVDFAPGLYLNFTGFAAHFTTRAGIGVRYQID